MQFPSPLLGWATKTSRGDLSALEVFVGIEVFVELSQSYNDFEEFVGPGAASAI